MQIGYFNQYDSIRKSASNCFGIRSDYIAGIFKIPSLLGKRRSFLSRKLKNKYSIKNFVRIRKSGMISVMSVLATSIIIVNSYSKSTGQECSIREFSSNSLVTQEVYILPKVSLTLNGLLPNLYAKVELINVNFYCIPPPWILRLFWKILKIIMKNQKKIGNGPYSL